MSVRFCLQKNIKQIFTALTCMGAMYFWYISQIYDVKASVDDVVSRSYFAGNNTFLRASGFFSTGTEKTAVTEKPLVRVCTMQERLAHVRRMCSLFDPDPPAKLTQFFVSDDLKLTYCFTPKCASTTFKRVMGESTPAGRNSHESFTFPHLFHRKALRKWGLHLEDYSNATLDYLSNFTKIFILRHPFDRLVSCYRDKFIGRDIYEARVHLRGMFNLNETEKPHFWMFIKYILYNKTHGLDRHWNPVGSLCEPCRLAYDYVLRVETLDNDLKLVLPILNTSSNAVSSKTSNVYRKNVPSSSSPAGLDVQPSTLDLFSEISLKDTYRLLERYNYDFLLGGYQYDMNTMRASCGIKTDQGDTCC